MANLDSQPIESTKWLAFVAAGFGAAVTFVFGWVARISGRIDKHSEDIATLKAQHESHAVAAEVAETRFTRIEGKIDTIIERLGTR